MLESFKKLLESERKKIKDEIEWVRTGKRPDPNREIYVRIEEEKKQQINKLWEDYETENY